MNHTLQHSHPPNQLLALGAVPALDRSFEQQYDVEVVQV